MRVLELKFLCKNIPHNGNTFWAELKYPLGGFDNVGIILFSETEYLFLIREIPNQKLFDLEITYY